MPDMSDISVNGLQHHGTLWMLRFDQTPSVQTDALTPVTWENAELEMAPALSQAMGLTDSTEVLQRFVRGCYCYLGKINDEIAAYGWVTFDQEHIGELDLTVCLRTGEAYIWDCSTLPAFRGLRLYPALLAYILNELRARGLSQVWIGADEDNVASQKGMALAGFRPIIDIGIMQTETGRRAWIRGRPGISEQEMDQACQAIIGAERLAVQSGE